MTRTSKKERVSFTLGQKVYYVFGFMVSFVGLFLAAVCYTMRLSVYGNFLLCMIGVSWLFFFGMMILDKKENKQRVFISRGKELFRMDKVVMKWSYGLCESGCVILYEHVILFSSNLFFPYEAHWSNLIQYALVDEHTVRLTFRGRGGEPDKYVHIVTNTPIKAVGFLEVLKKKKKY